MRARAAVLALAPLLAGCSGLVPVPLPIPLGTFSTSDALSFIAYDCADGRRVEVAYPSPSAVVLQERGFPRALDRAPSASGARYVGQGIEWRTEEGTSEGTLSRRPAGEDAATGPGVVCTAAPAAQ